VSLPSVTAYAVALEVVDDALAVADDAIKRAAHAEEETERMRAARVAPVPEAITLTKVASSRYHEVAHALKETGSFPDYSETALAQHLESGGPAAQLEVMEKLASRAVFDMGSEIDLGGSLVKQSENRRTSSHNLTGKTALWRAALDETDAELSGTH